MNEKKKPDKPEQFVLKIQKEMISDFRKLCSFEMESLSYRIRSLIKTDLLKNRNLIKNPESQFLKQQNNNGN